MAELDTFFGSETPAIEPQTTSTEDPTPPDKVQPTGAETVETEGQVEPEKTDQPVQTEATTEPEGDKRTRAYFQSKAQAEKARADKLAAEIALIRADVNIKRQAGEEVKADFEKFSEDPETVIERAVDRAITRKEYERQAETKGAELMQWAKDNDCEEETAEAVALIKDMAGGTLQQRFTMIQRLAKSMALEHALPEVAKAAEAAAEAKLTKKLAQVTPSSGGSTPPAKKPDPTAELWQKVLNGRTSPEVSNFFKS